MINTRWVLVMGLVFGAAWMIHAASQNSDRENVVTGAAAFRDYRSIRPGLLRKITVNDLPQPVSPPPSNPFEVIQRPQDAWPKAPAGFKVELYASELENPRQIRVAPNGDLFVAETQAGKIKVFRGHGKDGKAQEISVFAGDMKRPFGIAFYPPGPNPQWVYVGHTEAVVRFPYRNGDLKATGPSSVIVSDLPAPGNHWIRDVIFSLDGKRLFVTVGSATNVDDPDVNPLEVNRANVKEYTPEGKFVGIYASGLRSPFGLAVQPGSGDVWLSNMEREGLGDNLPPDFITRIRQGDFFGWPWYYAGGNYDPRHIGKHPELKAKVTTPDVLMPAHNAVMGLGFYEGSMFPSEYQGDLFAAVHGSWNRSVRAGYELVRVPLTNGRSSGVFEDFMTGFTTEDARVWGRPVGVAAGKDGALYVTDDGFRAIWRISY